MKNETINVKINGKDSKIKPDLTIAQMLLESEINIKLVAVAINGFVIRKSELSEIYLSSGDEIEIVKAVGGG